MNGATAETSAALPEATSRRRLLALLGAGVVASLFSRDQARAGHDGTNVLHLGEFNHAPGASGFAGHTILEADLDGRTFKAVNTHPGPNAGALEAFSFGGGPAVQGNALDPGAPAAVLGVSHLSPDPEGFGKGAGNGVFGESGSGNGVVGVSESGTGVAGHSDEGIGGSFSSSSGDALVAGGSARVEANGDSFALGVDNQETGEGAGGIYVTVRGGKPAIEGDAGPSSFGPGIGVQGVSGLGTEGAFGQGPGVGVQGLSGTGVGVEAISESGLALLVRGKAGFTTAGAGVVPAGRDSVFVADAAVTEDSHITVTLTGDPGQNRLAWVERAPGSGFTVHLSGFATRNGPGVPLTYLIVEPA